VSQDKQEDIIFVMLQMKALYSWWPQMKDKVGKQEVGIWWVQKRFPWYGVPIWSLWPNIRSLPSIVAEKNVTKNVHIWTRQIPTSCLPT
jgi:hypothetical protein